VSEILPETLKDPFDRSFRYLRLSVTKRCNFNCTYCLPNGSTRVARHSELSVPEISNLVGALAELGIRKVRLTGGEPTVRADIVEIARAVRAVPGIRQIALTTNGYRLAALGKDLRDAGVTALNVSVDSLHRERFHAITGHDRLPEVLSGIDRALELGFERLKVNVVLLRDINDSEIESFIEWTQGMPISVRFIELMRTGDNGHLFESRHVSSDSLRKRLEDLGWARERGTPESGPAQEWSHSDHLGRVGVIAPYSRGFCETCNRLRITSEGALRLCLFGDSDFSLRSLLQEPSQREELKQVIQELLRRKPSRHLLHEGKFGNVRDLARIGG